MAFVLEPKELNQFQLNACVSFQLFHFGLMYEDKNVLVQSLIMCGPPNPNLLPSIRYRRKYIETLCQGLQITRPFPDDGILVIPTVADPPPKLRAKKGLAAEFHDRVYALLTIATMSGGCQVTIPLGKHDDSPISVSFIASHGTDKFLLDTVVDIYSSLQEEVNIASSTSPLPDSNGNMDASELLKEKGNAAYKGKQWNKAVTYYTEAIKLNETNATYYSNRAAAYLELGCFQQAEDDGTKAISLDKKNVKAYLRRGTARESLLFYKEALQDFKHALVLEPQNKVANMAEKRLRKLIT
ncbi:Outer envelope protein 64 [Abeliophyllum distichum]|uniref:Outer envelope protein 64 n=1 Tax=Abeliophyllum distichum TaxID=126358 RepID=A0ABD1RSH6_9LAMI